MLRTIAVAVISVSVLGSTFVLAHHGGSMYPNREDESILEDAVVGEFLFVNPHARLLFSWTDADGTASEWEGELSGSTELVRSGVYASLLGAGDRITVKGYLHSSIPRNLRLSSVVLPDGREVPLP